MVIYNFKLIIVYSKKKQYFVAIYGKFGIEVQKAEAAAERYVISTGDMVDIKIGGLKCQL